MIKEENKYYGEIWEKGNKGYKSFCILEKKNLKLRLETNLLNDELNNPFKIDIIHGVFAGLGYFTFVNNLVVFSSGGISEMRIYEPQFTFISENHFVETEKLKFKKFNISNPQLEKWIWINFPIVKFSKKIIELGEEIREEIDIDENLTIKIETFKKYNSERNNLILKNFGGVEFKCEKSISFLKAIELYNTFQKFLFFFSGKSIQFNSFRYNCLRCDKPIEVYYKDKLSRNKYSDFLKLDYEELKKELPNILKKWFLDENIIYCSDVILENMISAKISHNRKFINSIFSFEAYSKRFIKLEFERPRLENYLKKFGDYFIVIGQIPKDELKDFIAKIIRTRDYYVHSNNKQEKLFTEFQLLYLSFLFDYIIGIELLRVMGVSEYCIKKVEYQAKNTYISMKSTNEILNNNVFLTK